MLIDKRTSAAFGLWWLAVLGTSTVGCDSRDCTSVRAGDRSVNGVAAFRFDSGLVEMDLATVFAFQHLEAEEDAPIAEQHLKLRWGAGQLLGGTASVDRVFMLIDIDGISGVGTFALEDLDAIACGCPPAAHALDDSGVEPVCAFHAEDGSEYTEPPVCERPVGELVVREHTLVCSSEHNLCAPRQEFDLVVPEQSGGRFSADIQVRWFDVIDEATCTDTPSTGVG